MNNELRKHLLELLPGKSAHIDLASALDGFPIDKINERPGGSPHSAWDLLEHIRIAQWDILEFSRNADHTSPDWPDGYWPPGPGTPEAWHHSASQVLADLGSVESMANDGSVDVFKKIEHGDGQTLLREILLIADHNAYHLGQLVLIRRMLEAAK